MRNLHYQTCFASHDGSVYAINLYEEGWEGEVVQLTAAANPFVTRENDDEDPFKPIRYQTGYIRIIDTDGSLFPGIIPPNNTHLMVRVYRGRYEGTYPDGRFVGEQKENIVWQGYVQSDAFTQPWTDYSPSMELPVVSMLGALQYLYFPGGALQNIPLREIISLMTEELYGEDDVRGRVFILTEWISSYNVFWKVFIQYANAQDEVTYLGTLNEKQTVMLGKSFYDVLAEVARLFGFTVREEGTDFYVEENHHLSTTPGKWFSMDDFSKEDEPEGTAFSIEAKDLLRMEFTRSGNSFTINQALKYAKVSLPVEQKDLSVVSLPEAPEDTTPPVEIKVRTKDNPNAGQGGYWDEEIGGYIGGASEWRDSRMVIQAPPRKKENGVEYHSSTYNDNHGMAFIQEAVYLGETITQIGIGSTVSRIYLLQDMDWHEAEKYDVAIYDGGDYVWDGEKWCDFYTFPSEEEQIRSTSVFMSPMNFPIWSQFRYGGIVSVIEPPTMHHIRYGALPVRFFVGGYEEAIRLRHGVYFNMDFRDKTDLLKMSSPSQLRNVGNYFNLNMKMHTIHSTHQFHTIEDVFGETQFIWDTDKWELQYDTFENPGYRFVLRYGDKYWNGSGWQSGECTFLLKFEDNKIPENFSPEMKVEDKGGYYIPIESGMGGTVEFSVRSCDAYDGGGGVTTLSNDVHAVILEDFSLRILKSKEYIVSETEENNYYRKISDRGFTGNRTVELAFGTYNNNNPGDNFIKDASDTYIEEIPYEGGTSMRPELKLLDNLQAYYERIRHVYTANLRMGTDWMRSAVLYGGRYFYGFIRKRDWKRDEEEITLIETV